MTVSLYDIHIYRVCTTPGNMWKEMSGVENVEVFFLTPTFNSLHFCMKTIFFPLFSLLKSLSLNFKLPYFGGGGVKSHSGV